MIGFIKNSWGGEAKLWKVFWLLGLLLLLIALPLYIALPFMLSPTSNLLVTYLISNVIGLFQIICIWKCAYNCGWKGWGHIARALVVLSAIGMVVSLVAVFSFFNSGEMERMEAELKMYQEQEEMLEEEFEGDMNSDYHYEGSDE